MFYSSYCCRPIGYSSYCYISTILLSAVTNFLCFSNYFFFNSSFSAWYFFTMFFSFWICYFYSFKFGFTACLSSKSLTCFYLSLINFFESFNCIFKSSTSPSFFFIILYKSRILLKLTWYAYLLSKSFTVFCSLYIILYAFCNYKDWLYGDVAWI